MKRRSLLMIFPLILGVVVSCSACNFVDLLPKTQEKIEIINNLDDTKEIEKAATTTVITMREIADFLSNKKEHYPLSDEFIERYQQESGGYIDYAKSLGLVVDREQHEPNQKWHFFESWLNLSIEQGSLSWEDNAKTRVYTGLKCPELLLWIYEACDVNPAQVKKAKEAAELGKVQKTNVATIAKNMRSYVAWEDLVESITKTN